MTFICQTVELRTLLLESTTLVIVLTTGEMNSMCSSKMVTLEKTFLEKDMRRYIAIKKILRIFVWGCGGN